MRGYMESMAEIRHRLETGKPKSRPTIYKGIAFRSRLEARFARHLDALGAMWAYEPKVYGSPGHGYLPDFEILGVSIPTFLEVKPTRRDVAGAQRKMSVIWTDHPDALLVVVCEEGSTFYGAYQGQPWRVWQERWAA